MNGQTYKNFRVECDTRGIVSVWLDVPGRPLNVLNREVLNELDQIVHDLENSDHISLVVFRSGKESGFLSGADVQTLANIDSAAEAMRAVESGQTLFQRVEWLPIPTIAVLHGPCLGGGLEWALACDYRIARDNSSTRIGLPEIKLGLIPGWGGTQRLPRQVGLQNALELILTGRHLGARAAWKMGLIDRAISPEHWDEQVDAFYEDVLANRVESSRSRRAWWQRALEATPVGRSVIFAMTEKSIRSRKHHYPALAAAVRAVREGTRREPDGFLCERDGFVELLASPTCRHLIELFFAREKARNLATWSDDHSSALHPEPIRKIGVVGAGAMGAGISQLCAVRGFDVAVKEIDKAQAEAGSARIEKLIRKLADRKGWSRNQIQEVTDHLCVRSDDEVLADCDLVIEAVLEREDIKRDVFEMLDRVVKSDALLASNTSSLSVSAMAEATSRADRVGGLHFFNPVHRMELVEVVRGAQTSEATVNRLTALVKALGKTPVVTADTPGFLVNRVLFPYLGEAVLMVREGGDIAEIDKQVRRFGMPMGPLQLLDQVGLDVALHVATTLRATLPHVQPVINCLQPMVDQGSLGKKAGRGFYRYRKGKIRGVSTDTHISVAGASSDGVSSAGVASIEYADDGLTSIQRRLVYPMLTEAVRCHEQSVVRHAWAIDLAMVLGTGFAPHRGGPLHVIDQIGAAVVRDNLQMLCDQFGQRFEPPQELVTMAAHSQAYFGQVKPRSEMPAVPPGRVVSE